jgi:cob(I)alamin adenosyltransferase
LYNGERRAKADDIFHALGHQDELNAVLGIAIEYCVASKNGLEDR